MTIANIHRRFLPKRREILRINRLQKASAMHTLCYCASSSTLTSPSLLHYLPMAAEELNRPPSLPPYTEMIFAAIDSLKEKDGSRESSISNYIESTCGYLPDEHSNILIEHLNKLVDNGELVVVNSNYMRPDPSTPAKRGRGRPPKPKDPAASESRTQTQAPAPAPAQPVSEAKRGRGRPKKDPNAPPSAKKVKASSVPTPPSKTGRPRGRPRKVQPELPGVEAN